MLWYGIYLWFMAFECGSSLQSRSLRGVNGVKIDPIGWKMWFLIKRKDLKWIVFFSSYRRLRWSTKATPPTFTWAHQTEASYETYGSPRTATWMSSCFQEAWLTCSRARRAKRRHALKPKSDRTSPHLGGSFDRKRFLAGPIWYCKESHISYDDI